MGKRKMKKGKGGMRAQKRNKVKRDDRDDRDVWGPGIIPHNEKFNRFYKAQELVGEEEWDEMLQCLNRQLPTTFRINRASMFASSIQQKLKDEFKEKFRNFTPEGDEDSTFVEELFSYIPWYPNNDGFKLNISKKQLRKTAFVKEFHSWLITQTDSGTITRQEEVSMIPPFLLEVKPHHRVLDMCAAPGSKTSQLIEMLHAEEVKSGKPPSGVVVANDADTKRAYMLVHQLKRLNSPYLFVSCHEGQRFPNIYRRQQHRQRREEFDKDKDLTRDEIEGAQQKGEGMFDRILADVPCSGDGTLRKCPDIWRKWDLASSLNLHPMQIQIAMRAVSLLEVGGLMVYSTCTFSPLENEAVVAEVLRRTEGKMELVDISSKLPGLKRRPGKSSWKVMDRELNEYRSFKDVPEELRRRVRATMFPPSEEERKRMNLSRCWRLIPHDQDTGGFFICLLRKVAPIFSRKTEEKDGEDVIEKADDEDILSSKATVEKEVQDQDPDKDVDAAAEPEAPANSKGNGQGKKKEKRMNPAYQIDEYLPLPLENWKPIQQYYGFPSSFPPSLLFSRSDNYRTISYVSDRVKEYILDADTNKRLKVVHTGVKILERNVRQEKQTRLEGDDDGEVGEGCTYRLSQEGLHLTLPHVTKRIVHISRDEYQMLLDNQGKHLSFEVFSPEVQMALEPLSVGCVVLIMRHEEILASSSLQPSSSALFPLYTTTIESTALGLVAWRGRKNLNLLVTKQDVSYILSQFRAMGLYREEEGKQVEAEEGQTAQEETDEVESPANGEDVDVEPADALEEE